MCVFTHMHPYYSRCMKVRRQIKGGSYLFLLCGSQGSNSDHKAWWNTITYSVIPLDRYNKLDIHNSRVSLGLL